MRLVWGVRGRPEGAVLVAVVFAVAGCGQQSGPEVGVGIGDGPAASSGLECPAPDPGPVSEVDAAAQLPLLARDVEVVAVLECAGGATHVAGQGEHKVSRVRRASGAQIGPLAAALKLPAGPRTDGACTADLRYPLSVFVETGAGQVLHVATPRDGCGHPLPAVVRAWQRLVWVVVSEQVGEQTRPEAAVVAGCEGWKDMLAITDTAGSGGSGTPTRITGPALAASGPLHVCVYESRYPKDWSPGDNRVVDGLPIGGGALSADQASDLAGRLNALWPASPCHAVHQRFAVLTAPGVDAVYVELDGCLRVLTADGAFRQGNAEVTAAVTG